MLKLLISLSILRSASGGCLDWFDVVKEGVCTGPIGQNYCAYTEDLRCMGSFCQNPGTPGYNSKLPPAFPGLQPVTIHNYKEQSYWAGMTAERQKSIFLALQCNNFTKRWEWFDGSVLDFRPDTKYSKDLDENCTIHGYPWFVDPAGNWIRADAHSRDFDWDPFCIGQLPQLPTPDSCDSFSEENDRCYQVGSPAKSWNDAQEACQLVGSELVSIHNEQENSLIHKLAISKGAANGLFIGGTFSANENGTEFEWTDGSEWDFDNRYAVEHLLYDGAGDCIAMDTFSSAGKWLNAECSKKLPYVCSRPDTTRQCPSGPWKEGDTITSPGFPYDASIACDYLLSVEPGKFVQVQIDELQANSCCDNLLLADDKIGGKVVAKLTGQIVAGQPKTYNSASNFMRVSWQPNGGVNVKGFKMTYRAVNKANEGPLTTTHTTQTLPTTTTTTTSTTTTSTPSTEDSTEKIATTMSSTQRATTSGSANYGASFFLLTLLSTVLNYHSSN